MIDPWRAFASAIAEARALVADRAPDDDGLVRIAVGTRLPADARNRIDTGGRARGAFICRIIGNGDRPSTRVRPL